MLNIGSVSQNRRFFFFFFFFFFLKINLVHHYSGHNLQRHSSIIFQRHIDRNQNWNYLDDVGILSKGPDQEELLGTGLGSKSTCFLVKHWFVRHSLLVFMWDHSLFVWNFYSMKSCSFLPKENCLFSFLGNLSFFLCQVVKDVIHVYTVIGTKPNFPDTKYGG